MNTFLIVCFLINISGIAVHGDWYTVVNQKLAKRVNQVSGRRLQPITEDGQHSEELNEVNARAKTFIKTGRVHPKCEYPALDGAVTMLVPICIEAKPESGYNVEDKVPLSVKFGGHDISSIKNSAVCAKIRPLAKYELLDPQELTTGKYDKFITEAVEKAAMLCMEDTVMRLINIATLTHVGMVLNVCTATFNNYPVGTFIQAVFILV